MTAGAGRGERPLVVCLVPVRDGAHDLPEFLASVSLCCDAVVALDDGSRDGSGDLLRASPLVATVLENPVRDGYAGWNDAANRQRLLDAAAPLAPEWILSLDVDERLDAEDAAALRHFLRHDAIPGFAFGLRHYRMWGQDACDLRFTWIYRVFAFRPGQRLPARRLHFDPVPVDIPRHAWLRTTIRVQHFGSADEERRLAAVAKYREADPDEEFTADFGGLLSPPPDRLSPWRRRDPSLAVLTPAGSTRSSQLPRRRVAKSPSRLMCLLPARNCAHDLPGYFESVARFADAIVALDDGSTDDTGDVLRRCGLVEVLLANPRREGYAGWNEPADRNRLLAAAAALDPTWILSLDADERLDEHDGAALRAFIHGDALPGFAYGFEVYPMVGDIHHYDAGRRERHPLRVYRLFAHEPGQRFPDVRLHAVPIPVSIPRTRWIPTTLRIQHLAGLTEARRRVRFAKYQEADPDRRYQQDYDQLLDTPVTVTPWRPRPPGSHVLGKTHDLDLDALLEDLDLDAPVMSAVVIARDDEDVIERAVGALVAQECPEPFEVVVVTSGSDRTAAIVRERFPDVTVVALARPALPGEARNAGLRVARGDYVTFPGSHIELPPGSLAARVRAHERGYPMVTGSVLNGTRTLAGWASYFVDHSSVLPDRPSGELIGPPGQCSYLRDALLELGGFPEDMRAGEDTAVNMALRRRGYLAFRAQDVTMIHHSRCTTVRALLRHHRARGRGHGRILLEQSQGRVPSRTALIRHLAGHVCRRIAGATGNVRRWGTRGEKLRFALTFPLVVAAVWAAATGAWHQVRRVPWAGMVVYPLADATSPGGAPPRAIAAAGEDRGDDDLAHVHVPGRPGEP